MNKNEKFLLGTTCFFVGAIAGFIISSIKKGSCCGKNCNARNNDEKDELDKIVDEVNEVIKSVEISEE